MPTTKQIGIAVVIVLVSLIVTPPGNLAEVTGRVIAGGGIVLAVAYLYNRRHRSTTQT